MADIQKTLLLVLLATLLTACSVNQSTKTTVGQLQKTEVATIIQLKEISTTNDSDLLGSRMGVSIGSGGYKGIYGSFDLGKIFSALSKPTKQLALMVKKQNGEIIAIKQPLNNHFKVGDKVRILQRNGRSVVEY
jgi:outer membrane lipoprotein SlyB